VLVLSDWIAGAPLETIERDYTVNPFQGQMGHGDIRRIADLTRLHLRSAHQIASVVLLDRAPDEAAMDKLLRRLEVGIPDGALDLLSVPVSLRRGEYLALWRAGAATVDAVSLLPDAALAGFLGQERAAEVKRALSSSAGQEGRRRAPALAGLQAVCRPSAGRLHATRPGPA
jgi:hypothetical protein